MGACFAKGAKGRLEQAGNNAKANDNAAQRMRRMMGLRIGVGGSNQGGASAGAANANPQKAKIENEID